MVRMLRANFRDDFLNTLICEPALASIFIKGHIEVLGQLLGLKPEHDAVKERQFGRFQLFDLLVQKLPQPLAVRWHGTWLRHRRKARP